MYDNKVYRCQDRIVSLSKPIRPIVRGKTKTKQSKYKSKNSLG